MVTDEMKADGWVEHDGGSCPMPNRGCAQVMFRNGTITFSRFGFWHWPERSQTNIDIVAYRPEGAPERIAA